MRIASRFAAVLFASLIATGCATTSGKPAKTHDQSIYLPKNPAAQTVEYFDTPLMKTAFVDHSSLILMTDATNNNLKTFTCQRRQRDGLHVYQLFVSNALVNAKNRLGGYTGFKEFSVYFVNGHVSMVAEQPLRSLNSINGLLGYTTCPNALFGNGRADKLSF